MAGADRRPFIWSWLPLLQHAQTAEGIQRFCDQLPVACERMGKGKRRGTPNSPRERSVKEHICASQEITYISYVRQKTIERTISECQRIFRDLNLFFRADSAADIQTARQIYDRASGNS